ncbi:M56 family metallopeptidase [Longimicrobium sp.]|uniref:M56 family metallopeptidase n=1 Tax=Longimicrobium sp. TaxID=2029185 RepID=UPI002E2EF744|nr:M56 family metallopeptidase [Longimicrobium sp.]HEX6041909.1 M56 family metallopeptidase [Longimicrobium sp.]
MTPTADPYRGPKLASREQRQRRAVLLGIGILIVLVLSPLFSHHLFRGTEALLAGKEHIGPLCLVALHVLMEPVHGAFHILFAAGVIYAVFDRIRAWRHGRGVLASLEVEHAEPGDPFWNAAGEAGVDPGMLHVVAGLPTPAFTIGLLRPRIYIARALAETLTGPQLAAVLAHEGAHGARRDPMRLMLLRFLTCMLFWIPALRRLAADVADEAEVQADDVAAAGQPLVLASAIVALARSGPGAIPRAAVGFQRPELLERRVRRLLGQDPLPSTHLTRRSLFGASVALVLVFISGAAMAHPLPADAHAGATPPEHCTTHGSYAALHLFCPEGPLHRFAGSDCPHAR